MTTFDADIRVASLRDSANAPIPALQVGLWPANKSPVKYSPFRIEITDQDGLVHFEFSDADYKGSTPLDIWILQGEDPPKNATVIDAASHSWTPAAEPSYARNILVDYPAPDNQVYGKVNYSDGTAAPDIRVRAVDVGLRSDRVLGQAITEDNGHFSIAYYDQDGVGEGKQSVDLAVRAFDSNGSPLKSTWDRQGDVIFEAGSSELVTLTVAPVAEYDELLRVVRPALDGMSLRLLDKDDQAFVVGDTGVDATHLRFAVEAAGLERETSIVGPAWYGLARQGVGLYEGKIDLDTVFGTKNQSLDNALEGAQQNDVIPAVDVADILARLDELRVTNAPIKQGVYRLVDAATGEPLDPVYVTIEDQGYNIGDPPPLQADRKVRTDKYGRYTARFHWPQGSSTAGASRTFSHSFYRDEARTDLVAQEAVDTKYGDEFRQVDIAWPTSTPYVQTQLGTLVDPSGTISQPLLDALDNVHDITRIDQVLANGGIAGLDSLPDEPAGIRRIENHALYSVVEDDPAVVSAMLDEGLTLGVVTDQNRFETMQTLQAAGIYTSDAARSAFVEAANAVGAYTSLRGVAVQADVVHGVATPAQRQAMPEDVGCRCEAHNVATSLGAYLVDLLTYATDHLQIGADHPLTSAELRAALHQPFGDLRMSTKRADQSGPSEALKDESSVRTIRIVIEVLRHVLDEQADPQYSRQEIFRGQTTSGDELPGGGSVRYRKKVWASMLSQMGTSVDEIRRVVGPPAPGFGNVASALVDDLAQRLAITAQDLNTFYDDLTAQQDVYAPSESFLQAYFGLRETVTTSIEEGSRVWEAVDPLDAPSRPRFLTWRRTQLKSTWYDVDSDDQDRPVAVDPDIVVPGELKRTAMPGRASELWRNRAIWMEDTWDDLRDASPLAEPPPGSSSPQDTLDAVLARSGLFADADMSESPPRIWETSKLESIADYDDDGVTIESRLEPYHLNVPAFRRLRQVRQLLVDEVELTRREWGDVFSILLAAIKRRKASTWKSKETSGENPVLITPTHFAAPVSTGEYIGQRQILQDQGRPDDGRRHPVWTTGLDWRADIQRREAWSTRLEGRFEQTQNLRSDLGDLTDQAAEQCLPVLRDSLLALVDVSGGPDDTTLADKARWVSDKFFIDAKTGACRQTTRMEQAILTLQNILRRARQGDLPDGDGLARGAFSFPNLSVSSFDEQWRWRKNYGTWKSAKLVYLYPEIFLKPSLKPVQSPAFKRLSKAFKGTQNVSASKACAQAKRFEAYVEAVSSLVVKAHCTAPTFVNEAATDRHCGQEKRLIQDRDYLFARSAANGRLYWSRLNCSDCIDQVDQHHWTAIPGLGRDRVRSIGGVSVYNPGHATGDEPSLPADAALYLFVTLKAEQGASKSTATDTESSAQGDSSDQTDSDTDESASREGVVGYVRYDLAKDRWDPNGLYELDLEVPDDFAKSDLRDWSLCPVVNQWPGERPRFTLFSCSIKTITHADWPIFLEGNPVQETVSDLLPNSSSHVVEDQPATGWAPLTAPISIFVANVLVSQPVSLANDSVALDYHRSVRKLDSISELDTENPPQVHEPVNVFQTTWTGRDEIVAMSEAHTSGESIKILLAARFRLDYNFPLLKLPMHVEVTRVAVRDGAIKRVTRPSLVTLDLGNAAAQSVKVLANARVDGLALPDPSSICMLARTPSMISGEGLHGYCIDDDTLEFVAIEGVEETPGMAANATFVPYQGRAAANSQATAKFVTGPGNRAQSAGLGDRVIQMEVHKKAGKLIFSDPVATTLRHDFHPEIIPRPAHWHHNLVLPAAQLSVVRQGSAVGDLGDEFDYFVPTLLAIRLTNQDFVADALDWFRSVYDYQSDGSRQCLFLERDRSGRGSPDAVIGWMSDPLNPHGIAGLRSGAYYRFTLLQIIQCMLAGADAAFGRDTAEQVEYARELYLQALDLLDVSSLAIRPTDCQERIEQLQTDGPPLQAQLRRRAADALRRLMHRPAQFEAYADELETQFDKDRPWPVTAQRIVGIIGEIGDESAANATAADHQAASTRARRRSALASFSTQDERAETIAAYVRCVHEKALQSVTGLLPAQLDSQDMSWVYDAVSTVDMSAGLYASPDIRQRVAPDGDEVITSATIQRVVQGPAFGVAEGFVSSATSFCVPENPLLKGLALQAQVNLRKIRQCRNFAGERRPLELTGATSSALELLGYGNLSSGQQATESVSSTEFRFGVVLDRAQSLAQRAGQAESKLLRALERRDAEYLTALRARQQLELTGEQVDLSDLRVDRADERIELAQLQVERARVQRDGYQSFIDQGLLDIERSLLDLQQKLATARAVGILAGSSASAAANYTVGALFIAQGAAQVVANEFRKGIAQRRIIASQKRREQRWKLQKKLAAKDIEIGNQRVDVARAGRQIARQQRNIATLQEQHADAVVSFLGEKFTDTELYDWMVGVLRRTYQTLLHEATAYAQLAERQLAFERQRSTASFDIIEADYWQAPTQGGPALLTGQQEPADRMGLTGSGRLQRDLERLKSKQMDSRQRKQELSQTISLARQVPEAFYQLRRDGTTGEFRTNRQAFFAEQFPAHYLRIVKRVRIFVVALTSPADGISATLYNNGLSTAVTKSTGGYHPVHVQRTPQALSFTSANSDENLFELRPQRDLLEPFEGLGVDSTWRLEIPRSTNQFDFNTIADVLMTVEYTALRSDSYRQQVLTELGPTRSTSIQYSVRNDFADPWYELQNWPSSDTDEHVITMEVEPEDLEPNLDSLGVEALRLFVVPDGDVIVELRDINLQHGVADELIEPADATVVTTDTQGGAVDSTRAANAQWQHFVDASPAGVWKIHIPAGARALFTQGRIADLVFVIDYHGQRAAHPSQQQASSQSRVRSALTQPDSFDFAAWLTGAFDGTIGFLGAQQIGMATVWPAIDPPGETDLIDTTGTASAVADGVEPGVLPLVDESDAEHAWKFPAGQTARVEITDGVPITSDGGDFAVGMWIEAHPQTPRTIPRSLFTCSATGVTIDLRLEAAGDTTHRLILEVDDGSQVLTVGDHADVLVETQQICLIAAYLDTTTSKMGVLVLPASARAMSASTDVPAGFSASVDNASGASADIYFGSPADSSSPAVTMDSPMIIADPTLPTRADWQRIFEVGRDRQQGLAEPPARLQDDALRYWLDAKRLPQSAGAQVEFAHNYHLDDWALVQPDQTKRPVLQSEANGLLFGNDRLQFQHAPPATQEAIVMVVDDLADSGEPHGLWAEVAVDTTNQPISAINLTIDGDQASLQWQESGGATEVVQTDIPDLSSFVVLATYTVDVDAGQATLGIMTKPDTTRVTQSLSVGATAPDRVERYVGVNAALQMPASSVAGLNGIVHEIAVYETASPDIDAIFDSLIARWGIAYE